MTSALWTQTDVIRIASTLLEPSSAPVILDSSLIWTKRRVKVGATSRGNTVTSRVIHLRFIVRKWLWPRDWVGGLQIPRSQLQVRSERYLGFFPEIKVELSKVTLEHESHVAFPSDSKQLFQNLDRFSFFHYVRIFLHSLEDFFLLHQLMITETSKKGNYVIQEVHGLSSLRPRPN